jgi:hypothetical protein
VILADNLEILKKLITTGLGAALVTEESIRKILSDISLPSEAKNYLLTQAAKRKEELSAIITREVRNFLDQVNIHEEIKKTLAGLTIDVEASIHIKDPNKPSIKTKKISISRAKKK